MKRKTIVVDGVRITIEVSGELVTLGVANLGTRDVRFDALEMGHTSAVTNLAHMPVEELPADPNSEFHPPTGLMLRLMRLQEDSKKTS